MKKMLAGLSLLAALGGLPSCDQEGSEAIKVPEGKVGYTSGTAIYSEKLLDCSAIILDFGSHALFAHALPNEIRAHLFRDSMIYVYDAVDSLVVEARRRGLDPTHAEAYVNAYNTRTLDSILKDLYSQGVAVRESNIDLSEEQTNHVLSRTVWFDPSEDSMLVYIKNFEKDD